MFAGNILLPVLAFRPFPERGRFLIFFSAVLCYTIIYFAVYF